MHRTKKLASLALAMVMVLAFIPVTPGAFAKTSPKATLTGDIINIPDVNFKDALPDSVKDKKGNVLKSKAKKLKKLDIFGEDITNLAGIEYFTALKELDCSYNELTELNVSKNTVLTELDFSGNQLTEIDVSKNTALMYLDCYGNQLTELDVINNTALTWLDCDSNQITKLNVSGCTALTDLYCSENQLTELNVSNNTALEWLECRSNQLTDISSFVGLNNLEYLDVSDNCIDITPGSPAMEIIQMFLDRGIVVCYELENESYDLYKDGTQPATTPSPNTGDSSLILLAGIVLMFSVGAVKIFNVRKTA